jgi:hypothetical protein
MSTTPATLPKLRSWLPPGCSAYPKPEDPTLYVMWLVSAMKNAGFSYETIIDAFLWDIGSRVKGIARQGSASAKIKGHALRLGVFRKLRGPDRA